MTIANIQNLYQQHIKPLQPAERLSLTAMIIQDLAESMPTAAETRRERSLLELEGQGAENGKGPDLLKAFEEAGFVGCGEGDAQLSVNYKNDLKELMEQKLGHGRILSTDVRDFTVYRWHDNKPFENLFFQ